MTFLEGDAQDLPCPDAHFDLVLSTVGVMFAPDHQKAADELVRVTAPGGKIALASWTPASLVAEMFKVISSFAPPPAGVRSPTKRDFVMRYHSPAHFSEWLREYYGPITRLAGTLADPARVRSHLHRYRLGDRSALASARLLAEDIDNPALSDLLREAP